MPMTSPPRGSELRGCAGDTVHLLILLCVEWAFGIALYRNLCFCLVSHFRVFINNGSHGSEAERASQGQKRPPGVVEGMLRLPDLSGLVQGLQR